VVSREEAAFYPSDTPARRWKPALVSSESVGALRELLPRMLIDIGHILVHPHQ